MKLVVYSCRPFDEEPLYRRYAQEFGFELRTTVEPPTMDNLELARGCDFISVLTTKVTAEMLDAYAEMGVKLLCTRTIGYDHIDIAHARKVGIAVSHVTYDITGVAEYTVMMMLMVCRRYHEMEIRNLRNDFTLKGLLGRELADSTVGIVGAGAIGKKVMRMLSGFGCRILYCNRSPSPEADGYAERVSMEELLERSDIVSLHLEHNDETHHIIDSAAISRMKDGAILVNTARGPLVDTEALISALKFGKLSAAALDVIEGEFGYYYNDCTSMNLEGHFMDRLRKLPNVILMHHMGFYYETAIRDMVVNSLKAMKAVEEGKEIPMRLD